MADGNTGPEEEPVPGITWLASYPKSGNTWTRILLSNLIAHEHVDDDNFAALPGTISSNRAGFDSVTGLPSSDLTDDEIDLLRPDYYRHQADRALQRLFVKVHDSYHDCGSGAPLFPKDCSFGTIYLVRHPFDVAISYANHQGHDNFDKVICHMGDDRHIMAGGSKGQLRQKLMTWSDHYFTWHQQDEIPVLTIRYEDMLADTASCLTRMAQFLDLAEKDDADAIARAVEESRFEKLRAKEDKFGFRERPEATGRFFRAGRAGDGWELLSEEQRAKLYEDHREAMEALGYEP